MTRNVTFLTGTRADYGKLKPLILATERDPGATASIFATGMHLLARYGLTVMEIESAHPTTSLYRFINQGRDSPMEIVLANTIVGLSHYLEEFEPDILVVHGDRVEALAGAIAGALKNITVVHVEGGELSGTIDGVIRHSISKLAHVHLVANEDAARRLRQIGEDDDSVFIIGSPDIDIMLAPDLPTISDVRDRYDIPFDDYGIVLFHPVTYEAGQTDSQARALVDALLQSGRSFVVLHPNNDLGSGAILREYERLNANPRFRRFESLRFEFFLRLLQEARCLLGNSSAGVREAPVYGVPSIDIGTRQRGRFQHSSIYRCDGSNPSISAAIEWAWERGRCEPSRHFGRGNSAAKFAELLASGRLWSISPDKQFIDGFALPSD